MYLKEQHAGLINVYHAYAIQYQLIYEAEEYGIEVVPPESDSVAVPLTLNLLSDEEYSQLCHTFNPLNMSNDCVVA